MSEFSHSGSTTGAALSSTDASSCAYDITFTEAGAYEVTCTVTDSLGNTNSETIEVEAEMGRSTLIQLTFRRDFTICIYFLIDNLAV